MIVREGRDGWTGKRMAFLLGVEAGETRSSGEFPTATRCAARRSEGISGALVISGDSSAILVGNTASLVLNKLIVVLVLAGLSLPPSRHPKRRMMISKTEILRGSKEKEKLDLGHEKEDKIRKMEKDEENPTRKERGSSGQLSKKV